MELSPAEQRLLTAGLRIIGIAVLQDQYNRCVYRVYTSDGSFTEYTSYDKLPDGLKEWMSARNAFDYIIPGCMFISCCKVV